MQPAPLPPPGSEIESLPVEFTPADFAEPAPAPQPSAAAQDRGTDALEPRVPEFDSALSAE